MKVLVSDNLSPQGVKILQKGKGLAVDVKTGLAPEELMPPALDIESAVERYG